MPPTPSQRRLLRLARAFEHQYLQVSPPSAAVEKLPRSSWQQAERLEHCLHRAHALGCSDAGERYRHRLRSRLGRLIGGLTDLSDRLRDPPPSARRPSLRLLYSEMATLRDEFSDVTFDLARREIAVRTEPITMDPIQLGRFEIRLRAKNLCDRPPYQVTALDPCPCRGQDQVTHPHVQNGVLCEGEGQSAIAQALADGRLSDFFLLIRQILRTFNPDSAYATLEDWLGVNCDDCDDRIPEEDSCPCRQCGCLLCEFCLNTCQHCETHVCSSCLASCDNCESPMCPRCSQRCRECHGESCPVCLEDGMCSRCLSTLEEPPDALHISPTGSEPPPPPPTEKSPTSETATTPSPHAPNTDGLGEACVPA